MDKNQPTTTKLQFITTDEVWNKVLKYKIEKNLKNNNQAVEELLSKALEPIESRKNIISNELTIPSAVSSEINEFRERTLLYEKKHDQPLLIFQDEKSKAFYTECHILASELVKLADTDATIDPEFQEEFRANRQLEPENPYFLQMEMDAKQKRKFSDIVTEYNTAYKSEQPIKVLGGQHRTEAIRRALKDKIDVTHGIRVYFSLNKDQRAEIMRISNTNINVSPDLRDRIEEDRLAPPALLREFCFTTGMLKKGESFGDKRRYEEEFSPTVRMIRSFIVNFYEGTNYKGDIDKDAEVPYLCKSGVGLDEEYIKIFNKFKDKGAFNDEKLIEAGKMFVKLHEKQFKAAEKFKGTAKKEYKLKAYSLSVITSWAYAAGVLQRLPDRLKKLYDLPDLSGDEDPLQANTMASAKHKSDKDTYRGLGTRTDDSERGRLLQLFLIYSQTKKTKINADICNAAISTFHSNQDAKQAEEKRKKVFE